MSTIPLPALDVRPPEQMPNLIGQYGQLMAIKNQQAQQAQQQAMYPLQQQQAQQQVQSGAIDLQQQQMKLKDAQAMQATMQQWVQPKAQGATPPAQDSSTGATLTPTQGVQASAPNYDDLVPIAIKNGASFQAVQGLQQHVLQMKAQAATIAKDQAQAGEAGASTLQKKNGMIVDAISGLSGVPDEQLPQAIQQTAQQLAQQQLFDPQHVQQAQQLAAIAQQNPQQARQQLSVMAASLGGFSKLVDDATKQLDLKNDQGKTDPNSPLYAPTAASVAMGTAPGATQIQAGQAAQAGRVAQAEAPVRIATAQAEGIARANIEAQVARGSSAALATVPPHLVAPASSDAQKAGADYAQAMSVSQRIGDMMDAAKRGNVVSYKLIPEEGALQVVTTQGVHRINMAEIQNYGGGNLWQNLQSHIGKATSGQSIPPSVLGDMGEIQSIMQKGAQSKYNNSLNVINQTYGSQFKPVSYSRDGDQQQPAAPQGNQQQRVAPPQGATQEVHQGGPGGPLIGHVVNGRYVPLNGGQQ